MVDEKDILSLDTLGDADMILTEYIKFCALMDPRLEKIKEMGCFISVLAKSDPELARNISGNRRAINTWT